MKLSNTLEAASAGDLHPGEHDYLQVFSLPAWRAALRAIEAQQVVNSMLFDSEGSYALQVPLDLPGNMKAAHIFIGRDKKKKDREALGLVFNVTVLMDLDVLGALRIDSVLRGRSLECLIHCENAEIRDFVQENLGGLKKTLETAGCRIDYLGCRQQPGLSGLNETLRRERLEMIYQGDAVNVFI